MEVRWKIQLFGGLRAEAPDRAVTRFRTQKTGVLLAFLAHSSHSPHSRDLLGELLWPDDDLETARQKLRIALSSLRRQLQLPGVPGGEVIQADRLAVSLNPLAFTTDVAAFEAALQAAAQANSSSERVQRLTQAVELYGGELLPGCYEEWVLRERERLAEAHLNALRELIRHMETRDLRQALRYARRAVRADPHAEEASRDLLRLLAAAGEHSAALQHYRELERRLKEAFDTRPAAATRRIVRSLHGQLKLLTTIRVGSGPGPVAVDVPANRIYVTNSRGDTVSVIDGARHRVVASIPVGAAPQWAGVNPHTRRIYVANRDSDTLSVIDGVTNAVIDTLPAGREPYGVAVDPASSRVYISNQRGDTLDVLDGNTHARLATIGVGAFPAGVGVDVAARRLYVANRDAHTLTVIDGETHQVIDTIAVGMGPIGVAVHAATRRVYVSHGYYNSAVTVIDGATHTVVETVRVGSSPWQVEVNSLTGRIYTALSGDCRVAVIDGTTLVASDTEVAGISPRGVAVNPQTRRIYVPTFYNDTLSVLEETA